VADGRRRHRKRSHHGRARHSPTVRRGLIMSELASESLIQGDRERRLGACEEAS
jgi:hypothetical protein